MIVAVANVVDSDSLFIARQRVQSGNIWPDFKNDAIDSAKVIAFVRKVFGSKADALITGPKPAAE